MASYDLNAIVSEAWTTPSATAANTAKATSESGSRSKMATNHTTGNFGPSLPVNEDFASFAAQLSQDDVARNLLLLSMISGNMPFGNTITGNMHPLFPSLLPIGFPHQQFSSMLPQNQGMAQLQQTSSERGNGRGRRRPANRSRSDRRTASLSSSRPCMNDIVPSRYMNVNMPPSVNSNAMQTYSSAANPVANVETLSKIDLGSSVGSNSVFTTRDRSRDHERSTRRSSAALTSATATASAVRTAATPGPPSTKSHSKQRYLTPSMTAIRGESPSSKSVGFIKAKHSAKSFKIPYVPSFNEAEAAATLLGMRHGQTTHDRNIATPKTSANLATSTMSTSKSGNGVVPATYTVPRDRLRATHHDYHRAIDLSTRTKSIDRPIMPNRCAPNSITVQRGNRLSTLQHKPPSASAWTATNMNETGIMNSAAEVTKRLDPAVGDIRNDTTSVVSRCGEYICAFDLPASAVKWTNDQSMAPVRSAVTDQSLSTRTPAQQQAFKYKKVICQKFSQCASPSPVTYGDSSSNHSAMKLTDNSSKTDRLHDLSAIKNFPKSVGCSKPDQNTPVQFTESTSSNTRSYAVNAKIRLTSASTSNMGQHFPPFTTGQHKGSAIIENAGSPRQSDSDRTTQNQRCQKMPQSATIDGINKLGGRHDVPSFHDLRQKSKDSSVVSLGTHKDKNCITNTSHENSFKSSNLYRIRNSAFGGSNDSLHSNSVKEDNKVGIDSESSSCTSDSEESADESDNEEKEMRCGDIAEEKYAITTVVSPTMKSSPQRARFVLSQPKFTLSTCESNDDKSCESESSSARGHDNILSKRSPDSKLQPNDKTLHQTEIPELKSDGTELEGTFKYKFIKALSNPDSKEGLAVDGKYLRALLGDQATCFYHNNKKYVLKRYLKPKHPERTDEPSKSARKTNHQDKSSYSPEPEVYRKIEPRISVTAVKRSDSAIKSQMKVSKKFKKARKRSAEISKNQATKSDIITGRRLERSNMDVTEIKLPHSKRRRRNHEIENLIYEGAGGKTPIPDLSLRDSDVFSNIKLRRREAAKRGIVQTKTPEERPQESKTVLCRKRIKTAAHIRAIANKNRKKSIESKLRKYGKKDRQLLIRKDELQNQSKSVTSRASCVRINAGFTNPQGSESDQYPNSPQGHVGDAASLCDNNHNNICVVSQERKCKPKALTDAILNHKTIDYDGDNAHDDDSRECPSHTRSSKVLKRSAAVEKAHAGSSWKIFKRNVSDEQSDATSSHYRRTSKRISNRQQSNNDRRSNEKKIDDDEISISSTNFETDTTRSDSPLRTCYHRNANNSKSKKNNLQATKSHKSVTKTRNNKNEHKQSTFSLMSCFPMEASLTLAAGFGDLQPSYSMKTTAKSILSSSAKNWEIGQSALGIKQQLQRDVWRNMTLDMFTNS